MSDYNLGTARGIIEVGYDGKGVKQAKGDFDDLNTKIAGRTSTALNTVSRGAGLAGLAVAAGLGLAVKTASSFESSISNIAAVSGATGEQLDQVRNKALQLGKDTVFSAGEAANAMTELAKAGVSLPDIMNGAADATVALAAAGEVSLPEAATLSANAMNQFNLAAKDMPGIADAIAGAANASAIDVHQFGESLKMVGAVANLAGLDFKDTATAIALMGNAGIVGSDAGTSLKSMLMNLNPQTDKARALMQQLGIITKDGSNLFYDATGKLKGMGEISQVLQDSLKGLTAQQKQQALGTMFGTDAIRAAAIMSNNGAAGFTKMADAMGKVKAADVAKTKMNNFAGSLEQLKGSLETLAIALGQILLPALKKLADKVTGVVNWFLNLSDTQKKMIVYFLGVAGGLLLMTAAFIKVTKAIASFKSAIAVMKELQMVSKLGFLANPWVLGIMAVIAVIALLIKYHKEIFAAIVGAWNAVYSALAPILSAIANFFTGIWNGIKDVFWAVINFITEHWKAFLTGLLTVVAGPLGLVLGLFISNFNAIKNFVVSVFNAIKGFITTVLNGIKGVFSTIWGIITGIVSGAISKIRSAVNGVAAVAGWFRDWFEAARRAVADKIGAVIEFLKGIGSKIKNAIGDLSRILYDVGASVINGLWNGMKGMWDKVTGWLGNLNPKKWFNDINVEQGHAEKNLTPMGIAVMDGLLKGMEVGWKNVQEMLRTINPSAELTMAPMGYAGVAARSITTNEGSRVVQIDARTYNPVAERASDTQARKLRTLGAMGAFR